MRDEMEKLAVEKWLERPTILPPSLRQIDGTRWWEFCSEYRVSLPPPFFPMQIVIPVGWKYDRSSIPEWVPQWIVNKDDLGSLAPAIHDAGYRAKGEFSTVTTLEEMYREKYRDPYIIIPYGDMPRGATEITREEVDQWFLLYMLRQRVTQWRAKLAYAAVRTHWAFMEGMGFTRPW